VEILLMFAVVGAIVHLYLWLRLVHDTTRPGRGRVAGTVVITALYLLLMATLTLSMRISPDYGRLLAWPGYLWLGLMMYVGLLLVLLEVPRLLLNRKAVKVEATVGAPPEEPVPDAGRRLFIARSLAVAGGLAATGIVGYGTTQALSGPVLKHVPITLAKLDPAFAGFRIAVVSDIHLGQLLGRGHTERIVEAINGMAPDLVAIVGDLVDGPVELLGEAAAPLRDLVSPHGSFFVTGNHEYYSEFPPWIGELTRLGVHPLRNERTSIIRDGASFDLAGVNDVSGSAHGDAADLDKALAGRGATDPVVLLAHQPVQVKEAAALGVDLQLSGHTHGGQVFPFDYVVTLQQPVVSGHAWIDKTQIYVSNGAGFWGPPVRVGAAPDITLIELGSA
jgi:predicted MPP superfamily phosphohydrolase